MRRTGQYGWLRGAMAVVGGVVSGFCVADGAGYYGEAQARRGEPLYLRHCGECHGARLEGATAVPLTGPAFRARWASLDLTVDDLFYIVRTQMPYGAPCSVPASELLDIVAFVLKANGYPGGAQPLPLDSKALSWRRLGP